MKQDWLIKRLDTRLTRAVPDSKDHRQMIQAMEELVRREKRRRQLVRLRKGYEAKKEATSEKIKDGLRRLLGQTATG